MFFVIAVLILTSCSLSLANYPCLCSYMEELNVYASDNSNSAILGSIYEFDCKATFGSAAGTGVFQAIQFEHQVGYIEKHGPDTVVQKCNGEIPTTDIVESFSATTSGTVITSKASTTPEIIITEPTKPPVTRPPTTTKTVTKILTTTTRPVVTTTTAAEATTTTPSDGRTCPDHWVRHYDSCYYFVIDKVLDRHNASVDCQKNSSHLATINTEEEQTFISSHLHGLYAYRHTGRKEVWIGGLRTTTGTYVWQNPLAKTMVPFQYTNWDRHEPATGSHIHPCVALGGENHYRWHSYYCTQQFRYICERPAVSESGVLIG